MALKQLVDKGVVETNHALEVRLVKGYKSETNEQSQTALRDSSALRKPHRLTKLEDTIAEGLAVFYQVGQALAEIREFKLYKELGYKTFESYCKERWDMKRDYANRQVKAYHTIENVSNGLQKLKPNGLQKIPLPESERVARELGKAPPLQQPQVWATALEEFGCSPTAHQVKQVVQQISRSDSITSTTRKRARMKVYLDLVEQDGIIRTEDNRLIYNVSIKDEQTFVELEQIKQKLGAASLEGAIAKLIQIGKDVL